jgi:3-methyladenine DNA glycosylase AlkD
MTATDVKAALRSVANPTKAAFFPHFFKTGPGQYGVTVPQQRLIARQFRDLPLAQVRQLLLSRLHEERLTALLLLVYQYEHATTSVRREIYNFYLDHTERINNWDLVDASAEFIVGPWLEDKDRTILERLARSKSLWERRIAIIATFHYIRAGQFDTTLRMAELLLHDPHDLIQKAVGWMLREVGKRDQLTLRAFLTTHYRTMPRTMLRYAIERFDPELRRRYLKGEV